MIAFSIGSIDIYWYGIFYIIAFLVAYLFLYFLIKKKAFNKNPNFQNLLEKKLDDIILFGILGVLVGGRLGYVIIYDLFNYINNPLGILEIWKGGMSFIGGMLGVVISMLIFKKLNKINLSEIVSLFDGILAIVPFGIMIGRIGNFLNQELYGIVVPESFRGMSNYMIKLFQNLNIFYVYDKVDSFLRVNTNLLSSFFEGFVLLVITIFMTYRWVWKGKYRVGSIIAVFLLWYSSVRFFLEYLRMDSQSEFILFLTKSQWFFVGFFILGLYFLFTKKYNKSV